MQTPETVNVLVVDDVQYNLDAMEALLGGPGMTILCASSGEAALELLLQHEVALALLDVNMPGMDGFALAEMMRANPKTRQIPLIFITAAMHEPRRTFQGYQSGAVDFLHKPFAPEILKSKVSVFVELYTQKKSLASKVSELQEALHTIEMFVAVLGHDLRTPLSAVLNGAELVSILARDDKTATAAKLIRSSGQRMHNMVRQLLEMAKIRSGEIALRCAPGDYETLCRSIIAESLARNVNAEINFSANGNAHGNFDQDRVAQILSNLIGNAIEHGETGKPIDVEFDGREPATVLIKVHNAGYIPAARLDSVFEPFQSVQQERSSASGLGLGLYIVTRFVEAHKGSISVDSTKTDGTTFTLKLPRSTRT